MQKISKAFPCLRTASTWFCMCARAQARFCIRVHVRIRYWHTGMALHCACTCDTSTVSSARGRGRRTLNDLRVLSSRQIGCMYYMCSAKKPRSARKRWFLKSTKTTRCTRLRCMSLWFLRAYLPGARCYEVS